MSVKKMFEHRRQSALIYKNNLARVFTISSSSEIRGVSITENKLYWLFYWAAVFTSYGASVVLLIKIAEAKNTNAQKKNSLKDLS